MSALLSLLPSLCLLCSSLSENQFYVICLHLGQMWLPRALLPTTSHARAWKRLIVPVSPFHMPRRENLLAWFEPDISTPVPLTMVLEPSIAHRSTVECRVSSGEN